MKKKTLSIVNCALSIAAASLLLGCESDTGATPEQDPRTPLAISAGVSTRAVDATWHANDAIGIYTLKTGTATVYDGQANLKYLNTAGQGATATFEAADEQNTAYFPADGSEVDIIAYYPHGEQLSIVNCQLSIDVSSQSSLPAIDLMTSALAPGHSAGDADVSLVFRHRLAKLAVVIKTDESTAHIDPSAASIMLHGTATKGVYNLLEQKIASATNVADIALAGRTAIVMPTEAGAGVSFTVTAGGKDFTATLPEATAIPAGKVTTVTITLKEEVGGDKIAAAIEATITDWEGGPTAEVEAVRFTTPANPETGEPEVTKFTVMKNGGTPTIYEYNAGEWSATPAFFYVKDITNTDKFTATATGAADPISHLTDDLEAAEATMNAEGVIALEFTHAKAQLTINLHSGAGFTGDLSTARVTYDGISYTGNGKKFVINPKNFAKDDVIATVEVDEHTYEAKATAAVSFAKGTTSTLGITLKIVTNDERTVALNITSRDWSTGTAATGTAVNIVTPDQSNTTGFDSFDLWLNSDYANRRAYTFANSVWSTTGTPFYIEDISGTDRFYARHTPTAATGQAPDIQVANAVAMVDGELGLTFAHIMSKLTVAFAPGTGYTAAELENAQLTVSLKDYASISSANVVTASTTATAKTIAAGSYVYVPGQYTDLAVSVAVGNNTYTGKVNLTLSAGSETTLTLTINKAGVGVNATLSVTDWTDGGNTGGDLDLQ